MNKRNFTITLLIWLFSQQLIAAVAVISDVGMNCVDHRQSVCNENLDKTMGHVASKSDEHNGSQPRDHKMINCDLCVAACQFALASNASTTGINLTPSELIVAFKVPLLDPVVSSTFRPPIIS